MSKIKIGDIFKNLRVIEVNVEKAKNNRWKSKCVCICGKETLVVNSALLIGNTKSCSRGCSNRKYDKHRTAMEIPEFKIWVAMKSRCVNKNNPRYKHYGGRGITVAQEWVDSFETFLNDMGTRPNSSYSIDRIDNNLNYCKENCRWATLVEQANNNSRNVKFTYKNEVLGLSQWARKLNIANNTLKYWLKKSTFKEVVEIKTPDFFKKRERLLNKQK